MASESGLSESEPVKAWVPSKDAPKASPCCQKPIEYDATRYWCQNCRRVLYDLNDGSLGDDNEATICGSCGGNGHAGGIDDMNCEECEGRGIIDA